MERIDRSETCLRKGMKSVKLIRKMRFIPLLTTSLLALVFVLVMPATSMAAQPPVDLGTTSSFAVLAGSTITNTGPTTINGDVGLHPGTAFTGQASVTVNGAVHLTDAVALQAKNDLVIAYDDAAGRTPVTQIATELGGTTLTPGVYSSASGTFQITGTLTLDAQGDPNGVFIFQTSTTLVTASDSNVNLINSARFCRIFWKVGSSATLGTNSHFVGHIFALASITANTAATVQGQLLARNGAVTLDTNTITNGFCDTVPAVPAISGISPTSAGPGEDVAITGSGFGSGGTTSDSVSVGGTSVTVKSWTDTQIVFTVPTGLLGEVPVTVTTVGGTSNSIVLTVTQTSGGTPGTPGGTPGTPGGTIPQTATPWYNILLAGAILTLVGATGLIVSIGWRNRKRFE